MSDFEYFRSRFSELYTAVKHEHTVSPRAHRGHGFDHDVTVAQMTQRILPDESFAEKVWVAAMVHSLDRLLPEEGVEQRTREIVSLVGSLFSPGEQEEVVQAALRHSEKNQDDQQMLQMILMDADRLVNLQPLIIVRAAQHRFDKPAVELQYLSQANPASTHQNPCSVLDDLRSCAEWETWFRLPKAKEIGVPWAQDLKRYIAGIESFYRELGLGDVEL